MSQAYSDNPKWTEAQNRSIQTSGKSVLVSAAAGSGKTSVLAERCVHLMCDAKPFCEVDELLVVTFTEAAAAEMRARIGSALNHRHEMEPSERTLRHMAILDGAQIGTLHGFCYRIVREHFQLLEVDPDFVILDPDEATLLKREIAREMLGELFDNDQQSAPLERFVDAYGDGDDGQILQHILRLHELLTSVVNPAGWMQMARRRIAEAIDLPLEKSWLGGDLVVSTRRQLQAALEICRDAILAVSGMKHFPGYVQHLKELAVTVEYWLSVLDAHGLDALAEESDVQFPRLPSAKGELPGKDLAKARVDGVKDAIKDCRSSLRFSTEQWKAGLKMIQPHVDTLLDLTGEFSRQYAAAKEQDRALDFADLERLSLRALSQDGLGKEPSAVARMYQKRFKHVLVDEYQDINEVQDAILRLVSREYLAENKRGAGNLFCVGDVKQSIYRFRLAEPRLFLKRRSAYSKPGAHGVAIDLQQNFRSRAPLLAAINEVFERIMTADSAELDYDESQHLFHGASYPAANGLNSFTGAPIELLLVRKSDAEPAEPTEEEECGELDRIQLEGKAIARRISQIVGTPGKPGMLVADASATGGVRPARFSDVVILMRSLQKKADELAGVLRASGIPAHSNGGGGYFEATEVNDVLSLLKLLDNAQQDIPLAAVLRGPIARLQQPEECLGRIRLAFPEGTFHEAVNRYANELDDELAKSLRTFLAQLSKWRQLARQRPLAEMLWTIYDQSGLLAFSSGLTSGEQRQANLIELHDRARQFGTFRRQGLSRFLKFIDKLRDEADLGQAAVANPAENVVRIMSIHRSKGLEFPVVILANVGKAINFKDCHGTVLVDREAGLGLDVIDQRLQARYPSLASTVVQRRLRRQTVAEEMRVLYVAMTRAKEHLILVGTVKEKEPELWQSRWAGVSGSLPTEQLLGATTMLDWLGPVAVMAGEKVIEIGFASSTEASTLALPRDTGGGDQSGKIPLEMVELRPLANAPMESSDASEIIQRLTVQYPHAAMTQERAAAAVTSRTKTRKSATSSGNSGEQAAINRLLPLPAFAAGTELGPADRGMATHMVLEHLDFSKAGSLSAIEKQIGEMARSGRLSERLRPLVDLDAIDWFLQQPVGKLVVAQAKNLVREPSIYFQELVDADDWIMLRGRLDVLVPVENGFAIVDYKTDRVSGGGVDQRVEIYRGQLAVYREAIQRIAGKKVTESVLVFLDARQCRSI